MKGDQFFSDWGFFLALVLCTNWCTTIWIMCPILCKIVRFLRKIECIKFVCTKFVLVLVQIVLLQFEFIQIVLKQFVLKVINSNCIRSICTKTNTNLLHTNLIRSISRKNWTILRAQKKIPKSEKNWSPFVPRYAQIRRISTKEKKITPL